MFFTPKNFEEFALMAKQGNVIPVAKRVPADLLTPVAAYLRLQDNNPYSFLLESIEGGEQVARYSFLGVKPHLIMRVHGRTVESISNGQVERLPGTLLDALRLYLGQLIPVKVSDLPPFTGGGVGYLNYDMVRWFERIPNKNPDELKIDDALIMFFSSILAFDHVKQQLIIIVNTFTQGITTGLESIYQSALQEIFEIEKLLQKPISMAPSQKQPQVLRVRSNFTKDQFEAAVVQAKEYIKAGDIFQVVLSQRFEATISSSAFQIYRALRMINPSPYMFYLGMGDMSLVGASPEMLVRSKDRKLEYRPIAGTRPRGADDVEDALLGEELRADEKEVAEHIMLVDLGRNDLGRVSEIGSVEVLDLMSIERYSHVMHMVSKLRSNLRVGNDCFDALMACFPTGTVSGAPKVRALEIIDELEPSRRGPYAGAVMYLDYSGNLDSCIAIRTILVKDNKAYIQAGAGIVADSVPEKEYIETVNKARALLKAVEIAEKEL
ncbi:MAG: anthranilate synthase component I [Acidobacteria bacterium]|nr:anthranilate synthase component I [Acidobacteriota bacterium]